LGYNPTGHLPLALRGNFMSYRETQSRPFIGFSVSLPAATVVELDPQPYSNTKEVIFLNRSATEGMLVSIQRLVPIPADSQLDFGDPGPQAAGSAVGNVVLGVSDTFTLNANVFTAVNGTQVNGAGSFRFAVPFQPRMTLTINVGGAGTLTAGDTITFNFPPASGDGIVPAPITWTAAAVPAGNEWDSTLVGDAAIAAGIATAIAGAANTTFPGWIQAAVVAANTVTFTLSGAEFANQGTLGERATVTIATAVAGAVTPAGPTNFSGAIDATLQKTATISFVQNDSHANAAWAINDASNVTGFRAVNEVQGRNPSDEIVLLVYNPVGAAGNGLVVSAAAGGRISVPVGSTPTANGVNAIPAALAAASSTVIPAGGAITLAIGSEGNRQPLGLSTWWDDGLGDLTISGSGSGLGILVQMEAGGPADLNVTYVQNRGYSEGV
jgi:hypothetical protein